MKVLTERGYVEPLKQYIASGKPFLGVCLGMQLLFESSEESPGVPGLGIIPGQITRFPFESPSVPQIGWNGVCIRQPSPLFPSVTSAADAAAACAKGEKVYFVHSFRALPTPQNQDYVLTSTTYGGEYISAVQKGNVVATQFHPEKSGAVGLKMLQNFLTGSQNCFFCCCANVKLCSWCKET